MIEPNQDSLEEKMLAIIIAMGERLDATNARIDKLGEFVSEVSKHINVLSDLYKESELDNQVSLKETKELSKVLEELANYQVQADTAKLEQVADIGSLKYLTSNMAKDLEDLKKAVDIIISDNSLDARPVNVIRTIVREELAVCFTAFSKGVKGDEA